jgi:hypothetical protein
VGDPPSVEASVRDTEQQIYGKPAVFNKCRTDKKFAYLVALARAVNALNSAHSLMRSTGGRNDPAAIRKMSPVYGKDKSFQDSLQIVLKDKPPKRLSRCT